MLDEEYLSSKGWIKEEDGTFTLPTAKYDVFKKASFEFALDVQKYWDWAEEEKIPFCS